MGNCLVTKLKGSVDNPNLSYIGYIKIHCYPVENPDQETRLVAVIAGRTEPEPTVAKIVNNEGNCYFTSPDGTANYGTEIQYKQSDAWDNDADFYVSNGRCDVIVGSKYTFSIMYFLNQPSKVVDMSSLCYISVNNENGSLLYFELPEIGDFAEALKTSKINEIRVLGGLQHISSLIFGYPELVTTLGLNGLNYISGVNDFIPHDKHNISQCINVTHLTLSTCNINLVLEDIIPLTKVTVMVITNSSDNILSFSGRSVEEFVQGQRAAAVPRQTCERLQWDYIAWTGISFNGTVFPKILSANRAIISWTASTITVEFNGETTTVNA